MKAAAPSKHFSAVLALITVSLIWGVAGPVIVHTLKYIPVFTFLFFRFAITTPILIPFLFKELERVNFSKKDWLMLLGMGFLGETVVIFFAFVGFQWTTAIDGTLINIVGPLLVILGGTFFLKERINHQERIGIAVTLIGSLAIILQPLFERGTAGEMALFGNMLVFLSTVAWATYCVWDKHIEKRFTPMMIVVAGSLVSLIFFTPFAYFEMLNNQAAYVDLWHALPGIVYMAIFSYIIAYYFYEWGVRRVEVSEASIFGYLQPIFALPVAFVLLGEVPTIYFWFGAILIAAGVFLTQYKPRL